MPIIRPTADEHSAYVQDPANLYDSDSNTEAQGVYYPSYGVVDWEIVKNFQSAANISQPILHFVLYNSSGVKTEVSISYDSSTWTSIGVYDITTKTEYTYALDENSFDYSTFQVKFDTSPSNDNGVAYWYECWVEYTESDGGGIAISITQDTRVDVKTSIQNHQDTQVSVSSQYQQNHDTKIIAKQLISSIADTLINVYTSLNQVHDTKLLISNVISNLQDIQTSISTLIEQFHDTEIDVSSSTSYNIAHDTLLIVKNIIENFQDIEIKVSSLINQNHDTELDIYTSIDQIHDIEAYISTILNQTQDTRIDVSRLFGQYQDAELDVSVAIEQLYDALLNVATQLNQLQDLQVNISSSIESIADAEINVYKQGKTYVIQLKSKIRDIFTVQAHIQTEKIQKKIIKDNFFLAGKKDIQAKIKSPISATINYKTKKIGGNNDSI